MSWNLTLKWQCSCSSDVASQPASWFTLCFESFMIIDPGYYGWWQYIREETLAMETFSCLSFEKQFQTNRDNIKSVSVAAVPPAFVWSCQKAVDLQPVRACGHVTCCVTPPPPPFSSFRPQTTVSPLSVFLMSHNLHCNRSLWGVLILGLTAF